MPRNYEAEDGGRREAWWRHVLSLVRCESAMLCDCATGVLNLVWKDEENEREGRVQLQVAGRIPLHALGTLCERWACRCVYLTGPAL